jgi:hypothetical protein
MLTIDRNDSGTHYETKFSSLKHFLYNEAKAMNDFFYDLIGEDLISQPQNNSTNTEEMLMQLNQNIRRVMKNFKNKLNEKEDQIALLNSDKRQLQEEVRSSIQNNQTRGNHMADKLQDELNYYKQLAKDYQNKLELEKQYGVGSQSQIQSQIQSQNYYRDSNTLTYSNSVHNNINNNEKSDIYNYVSNNQSRERDYMNLYSNPNENALNNSKIKIENQNSSINNYNTSLDNFRRNKDLRLSTNSNNNYDLKLENRYSDSNFYKFSDGNY